MECKYRYNGRLYTKSELVIYFKNNLQELEGLLHRSKPLDEQIKEVFYNNDFVKITMNAEDLDSVEKPTEAEIKEYKDLNSTLTKTKEQRKRWSELRTKIFNFRLAEDTVFKGKNLLELMDLAETHSRESKETRVKNKLNSKDADMAIEKVNKTTPNSGTVTIVPEGVFSSKGGTVLHMLSVEHLSSILEKIGQGLELRLYNNSGEEIPFTDITSTDSYMFEIVKRKKVVASGFRHQSQFVFEKGNLFDLAEGFLSQRSSDYGYNIVYSKKTDGTSEPVRNTFQHENINVKATKSMRASYSNGKPKKVTLSYPRTNKYNKALANGMKEEDAINDENYIKNALIPIKYNNRVIGLLPSARETTSALYSLRVQLLSGDTISVELDKEFLNYPKLSLDNKGEVLNRPVNKNSKNFKGIYYAHRDANGELQHPPKLKNVNHQFVEGLSDTYEGVTYMVVDAGGGKLVSYPVQPKLATVDMRERVNKILEMKTLSSEKKATLINQVIINNKIQHDMLSNDLSILDINKFKEVEKSTVGISSKVDNTLEAVSHIDVDDPFMLPKFKLNLYTDPKTNSYKTRRVNSKGETILEELKVLPKKRKVKKKIKSLKVSRDNSKICKS